VSATQLKEMTRTRELKLGHFILEFDSPGIGYIIKNAGADFAVFDMEHSGFGLDRVKPAMAYMRAAKLPVVVRVPSKDYKDIARVCDAGADGIMLPMVGNVEEAQHIIDAMKYPPRGKRGVILRSAVDCYTEGPTIEKLKAQNERTTLFAQIETAEGLENVEAIAALEDVDCLFLGHFDLSCSLGIPGDFENVKFKQAIERIIEAGRQAETSLGRLVGDVQGAIASHQQGFDFVAYGVDAWLLGDALKQGLDRIRAGSG